nr:GTP-binding protein [Bacilli bacterium]
MKEYLAQSIRNIAIMGHQGSGKTTLAESVLFVSKAIEKKGEVERKNTVSDYLPEEHVRQTSLTTSLIPVEWKDHKINFLDLPGSEEFVGEVQNALSVVDGAVLLVDASAGVQVGTELAWQYLRTKHIPTIILINKMDKENVKFEDVLNQVRKKLGHKAVPFCWPLGKSDKFDGFANVIDKKALIFTGQELVEGEIYPDKMAKIEELYNQLTEAVAETSEEMLEKYFSGEELTLEEIKNGLRVGTLNGEIFPVVISSATKDVGISTLLDMIIDYLPSPADI